jgi:hypothetical protein
MTGSAKAAPPAARVPVFSLLLPLHCKLSYVKGSNLCACDEKVEQKVEEEEGFLVN